jgi:inorganic pyrophosphatase
MLAGPCGRIGFNMYWKKLNTLVKTHRIIVDRQKGTRHPKYKDLIYTLDYGYLENTSSMDNNGIDIIIGSKQSNTIEGIICTIDQIKNDSEIKIIFNCTEDEIENAINFFNTDFMGCFFIRNETNNTSTVHHSEYNKPMLAAINEAITARSKGEDPFGAVLLNEKNEIVHLAHSKCIEQSDPTAHAELLLIREYCQKTKEIYLHNYSIVCSAEPCVMCSGAIKWAKISKVIYSTPQQYLQKISGGKQKPTCDSILNTGKTKIEVVKGVLFDEGTKVFDNYLFKGKNLKKFS